MRGIDAKTLPRLGVSRPRPFQMGPRPSQDTSICMYCRKQKLNIDMTGPTQLMKTRDGRAQTVLASIEGKITFIYYG